MIALLLGGRTTCGSGIDGSGDFFIHIGGGSGGRIVPKGRYGKECRMAGARGWGRGMRGRRGRLAALGMAVAQAVFWCGGLSAGAAETSVILGEALRRGTTTRV